MKKLLVLFVVLAVASSAFAADFSWSWDTDWGWSSDFDENYTGGIDELELGLSVDIDEYNVMATQIEAGSAVSPLGYDYFKITTDLGAYLGLSGVGVSWVNGYTDPGDEEYSDVLRVGLQNAGLKLGLTKDLTTDVNLDFGAFWASVASNWNLAAGDETVESYTKEMLFLVGSVDAVPGLSIEAGYLMSEKGTNTAPGVGTVAEKAIVALDAAYVFAMDDAMSLTVAGSFATDSEATSPATGPGTEQFFGAGLGLDYMVDDMTALNASVEFKGGDDETLRVLGGGAGLSYGDFGVDADFAYALGLTADTDEDGLPADGDMLGVDISGYVNIGMVKFRLGYAVTDFGWTNNANSDAGMPKTGGAYMVVTADF